MYLKPFIIYQCICHPYILVNYTVKNTNTIVKYTIFDKYKKCNLTNNYGRKT